MSLVHASTLPVSIVCTCVGPKMTGVAHTVYCCSATTVYLQCKIIAPVFIAPQMQEGEAAPAAAAGENAEARTGDAAATTATTAVPTNGYQPVQLPEGSVLHVRFEAEEVPDTLTFFAIKDSFGGQDGGVKYVDYTKVCNPVMQPNTTASIS